MTEQPMPIRGAILQQALEATTKARNVVYGDPSINLQCAGELKAVYARYAGDKYCEAHDEAIEMVLTKIGRVATGQPGHDDTYIDAAAYMAIAAECQTKAMIAESNRKAMAVTMSDQEALAVKTLIDIGLVIDDPINRDTALPKEPERVITIHEEQADEPKPRKVIMPMIDADSPAKEFSDGRVHFKVGSLVQFTSTGAFYLIQRIESDDFGSFTAQHESNGHVYKGLGRHVHRVVTL